MEEPTDMLHSAAKSIPPRLIRRLHVRLLPLLWSGYVINQIDKTNIAYAQLQMQSELSLTPSIFGLASGIFFVGYALAAVPSNHLMGYIGARPILGLSLILWGLFSCSVASVQNHASLLLLRFCTGLAESGFFPGAVLFISSWYPNCAVGEATAVFITGGSIGAVLANASSGVIMSGMDNLAGISGWRWLFLAQGAPAVLLGLLVFKLLPATPDDAHWLSCSERQLTGNQQPCMDCLPFCRAFRCTLQLASTWVFALQYFLTCMCASVMIFFLPLQVKEIFPNLPSWAIGFLVSAPSAVKCVVNTWVATWADSGGRRRRLRTVQALSLSMAILLLTSGLGMLLLSRGDLEKQASVWFSCAVVCFCIASCFAGTSLIAPIWALHHSMQPRPLKPVSIAVVNSVGNLGSFVSPALLGVLSDVLGPACTSRTAHGCISQWGWGTILVGAAVLLGTLGNGCAANHLGLTNVLE